MTIILNLLISIFAKKKYDIQTLMLCEDVDDLGIYQRYISYFDLKNIYIYCSSKYAYISNYVNQIYFAVCGNYLILELSIIFISTVHAIRNTS